MRHVLICVFVLASSGAAWAGPGGDLCARAATQGDLLSCTQAVSGKYISPDGAQLCSRVATSSDVVACARTIAGHEIAPGAANACGRVATSSDVVRCAAAILDKNYEQDDLDACGRMATSSGVVECMESAGALPPPPPPPAPARGGKSVDEVCDSLSNDPDADVVLDCFDAVRGRFVSRAAAAVCARIENAGATLRCVKAIAGKRYDTDEVERCDGEDDARRIVSCFEGAGVSERRRR